MMLHKTADKVLAFTQDNALFSAPCHLIIGVSGGADSVTLLHLLHHWPEEGLRLTAVHVHHGLRGDTADRDAAFVSALCDAWGIPLVLQHANVAALAKEQGIGLEEAGRCARYRLFEEVRQSVQADCIVTAHTASDQVETVLMHLVRGCGSDGLCGIPAKRFRVCRPLLTCSREEIEDYCRENALQYMTDETNADVRFTRNRVRHELLPLMRQLNPAVDNAILRLSGHVAEDCLLLNALAESTLKEASLPEGGYRAAAFSCQEQPVRRRMIRAVLRDGALPQISEAHILAVEELLANGRGETVLPQGTVLCAEDGRLFWRDEHPAILPSVPVSDLPFSLYAGQEKGELFLLDAGEFEKWKNVHKMFFKYSVDYDRIQNGLHIRCRREGDYLHPAGRGIGKSLKKLMNEWRIPASRRDCLPLLCDETGVLLVPGYACDERVKITEATKHFLVWQPALQSH